MTMRARWTGDAPASDDNHGIALTPTDVRAFASDMGLDDCCDVCGWPVGPQAIRDGGWTYCDTRCKSSHDHPTTSTGDGQVTTETMRRYDEATTGYTPSGANAEIEDLHLQLEKASVLLVQLADRLDTVLRPEAPEPQNDATARADERSPSRLTASVADAASRVRALQVAMTRLASRIDL